MMEKFFYRIFFLLTILFGAVGCGVLHKNRQQPSATAQYVYKDSTIIKDSIRIIDLPVERVVDVVPVYDTLLLETSLAKSKAWVDAASHVLMGKIENKKRAPLKVEYRERVVYRDSIDIREVEVPYEVVVEKTKYPALFWVLLVFSVMVLGKNIPKFINAVKLVKNFDWKKLMFWKKKKAGQ